MSQNKTITIFCGYYLPHLGGVERYVDKLSHALLKLGYKIIIVTSNHGNFKSMETVGKIKVYRLPMHSLFKERYPILRKNTEYKSLISKIREEKSDYIICNTRFHLTSLLGAKIGREQRVPVILVEHGTGHFTVGNKVLDFFGGIYEHFLTSYIKRYVNGFYGVSKNCNKWLKHFNITAAGVFYNAINKGDGARIKDYYSRQYPSNEVVITYAGRILREKGVVNLLDAYCSVRRNNPNIRLVIAGDGDLLDSLRSKYEDIGVDFLGRLDFDHVMSLYARTDIFVYPSLYPEGLPTSVLEAGLMHCAIIATARGGTEEVIPDHDHGIIIDGSQASIEEALSELILDKKKRQKMADSVKFRVENVFDWNVVAKKVAKELEDYGKV